jgi:hypothetical protein
MSGLSAQERAAVAGVGLRRVAVALPHAAPPAAHERNTEVPRADLHHAPAGPSRGRRRAAIQDRRARRPDNMPQVITVTDAEGRWAVYVPLRIGGKIVVPEPAVH